MTPDQPGILETGMAALAAGLSPHPCLEDGIKAPLPWFADVDDRGHATKTWLHPAGEPPAEAQVRAWYGPRRGIGLRCGAEGGGLEVVEFDDPGTYAAYREAADACGLAELLERVEAGYLEESPGGGMHLLYLADEVRPNAKLARTPREPTGDDPRKVATLIETRGEHGFIVIAPSGGGVHKSGRPYVLLRGGIGTIAAIAGEERDALWSLARTFDRMPPPPPREPKPVGRPPGDDRLRPGDDFNARATWDDVLGDAGWAAIYRRGEATYWRRPGKDRGVSATTNHRGSGLLWVFSASTEFEAERSYTKLGAYALLEHGGNFSTAATALRKEGYGSAPDPRRDRPPGAAPTGGPPGPRSPSVEAVGDADEDGPVEDRWPRLNPWAYHGIAGEIVRRADPHTEADPVAVLAHFLVGFANSLDRGPHWFAGATAHYMSLFVALVGPTAAGRKGSSWDVARYFLDQIDPKWARERYSSGLSSGEGLIHQVRDKVVKTEKGVETVVDEGVEDKRLFLVESELARTLKVMGREGATLSSVLRHAWDCPAVLSNNTKNSALKASRPFISMVGHITPDELMALLTRTDAANGLGNRFVWLLVRRSKELPEGGEFMAEDWGPLVERLRDVRRFAREVGTMRRDDEARAAWAPLYSRLTAGKPGLMGAMLGRAEAQVMRLASVYALLDRSHFVRLPHLRAAVALWEYSEASARFIFGAALADPKAERVIATLLGAPAGLGRSEIRAKAFNGHIEARELTAILQELLSLGMAHRAPAADPEGGHGRAAEVWKAGRDYGVTPADLTPPDADLAAGWDDRLMHAGGI